MKNSVFGYIMMKKAGVLVKFINHYHFLYQMKYIKQKAKSLAAEAYSDVNSTRRGKLGLFTDIVRLAKFAYLPPTRGRFLNMYYALMRRIDDVVDGDVPLPGIWQSKEEYVQNLIDFSLNPVNPRSPEECLMRYCLDLGRRFGYDFREITGHILRPMLFDARRFGEYQLFSASEFADYSDSLDILGTIRGSLIVFGEDPEKADDICILGRASRIYYTLRDFWPEDSPRGYVNIPVEDFERLGIDMDDIKKSYRSRAVDDWMTEQANEGMMLLSMHRSNLEGMDLKLRTRTALSLMYEFPARLFFNRFLGSGNSTLEVLAQSTFC